MTSQTQRPALSFSHRVQGKEGSAQLAQLKLFDSKRLVDLMGTLPDDQYDGILDALAELFLKKKTS